MASGPQHYIEAECALTRAGGVAYGSDEERFHLAAAQVHATLALAAATAMFPLLDQGGNLLQPPADARAELDAWKDVASVAAELDEEAKRQEGIDATREYDPDLGKDLDDDEGLDDETDGADNAATIYGDEGPF